MKKMFNSLLVSFLCVFSLHAQRSKIVDVRYDGPAKVSGRDTLVIYFLGSIDSDRVVTWVDKKVVSTLIVNTSSNKLEDKTIAVKVNKSSKKTDIRFKVGSVYSPEINVKKGYSSLTVIYFKGIFELRFTNDDVIIEDSN